jgi:hypothetical protein
MSRRRGADEEKKMRTHLSPSHPLFADLSFPSAGDIVAIKVSVGAVDACCRHLNGTALPCVLYPQTRDGKSLGTAAHPGFVVELVVQDLVEADVATEDECYLAAGAEVGTYPDTEGPCCGECLAAADEYDEDEDAAELPKSAHRPCWSCCQMIDEGWTAADARAYLDSRGILLDHLTIHEDLS